MPPVNRIPFVDQAYESRSLPFAAQTLINLYPERAEATARNFAALFSTPGLSEFTVAGSGPIRGLLAFNGFLYAVSGQEFYKIDNDGVAVSKGIIPGNDIVSMSNNRTQICIVNGIEGFIYSPYDDVFQKITDINFNPSDIVTVLDQYFVFHEVDTDKFFISNLANGLAYDALAFATAEGEPDNIISILVSHNDLILFGENTTEFWEGIESVDFPFAPQAGLFMERGCGARFSTIALEDTIYFLGDNLIVYRMEGYRPVRISTHAIESKIQRYDRTDDAIGFGYTELGHYFYVLTFPTGDETWVYDVSANAWHQRSSGLLKKRWRPNNYARFDNKNIVGDGANGTLWHMDLDTYTEGDDLIRRERATMIYQDSDLPIFLSKLQIILESGTGTISGQGSNPLIGLEWSDDGGRTWSDIHTRPIGKIGEYTTRVIWRRLGRFRNRIFRLTMTDPVKLTLIDASADFEKGI